MNQKIDIIEVVYKDPRGMEAGGLENYALNIKRLLGNKNFNIIFAYSYTGNINDNSNKKDIRIKISRIPIFKKLIFNIKLYNYLKKQKWKGVIHINGDDGVFCTRLKHVKTVFTLHGSSLQYASILIKTNPFNFIDMLSSTVSGLMELYAYLTADSVTGVSRYCLDFMGKFKNRSYNIIPPCIEKTQKVVNKNKYRATFGFEKDQLLCIFVGGDAKRKGLDTAINAIGKINSNKIKLLIVGPTKKPKINKNCKFFGRVDKKTLERLYSISDILFFPSKYEGFPAVISESMSFGVVPLVYNKKPFNEIANNENSFLVDYTDEFSYTLSELIYNRKDLLKRRVVCKNEAKRFLAKNLFSEYSKIFKKYKESKF